MENRDLNQATLQYIAEQNTITVVQAEDLWKKCLVFNDILIKKYGDSYMKNLSQILVITRQYQDNLIKQYRTMKK